MDAAGQDQHAGEIAMRVLGVERGGERPARTFEPETVSFRLSSAGCDVAHPFRRVDAAIVQDAAEADSDVEIGPSPGVDDERKLASQEPIEDRDQPLVAVKLHGAFSGDPVGAIRPAGAVPPCAT
jgi:hypothetical protein